MSKDQEDPRRIRHRHTLHLGQCVKHRYEFLEAWATSGLWKKNTSSTNIKPAALLCSQASNPLIYGHTQATAVRVLREYTWSICLSLWIRPLQSDHSSAQVFLRSWRRCFHERACVRGRESENIAKLQHGSITKIHRPIASHAVYTISAKTYDRKSTYSSGASICSHLNGKWERTRFKAHFRRKSRTQLETSIREQYRERLEDGADTALTISSSNI